MADPPTRNGDDVVTDVRAGEFRVTREISRRGFADAAAIARGHGKHCVIEAGAGFDFREHNQAPPPRDEINFAAGGAETPVQDRKSF